MISGYPYFRKPPDTWCTQGKPIKMYHTQYIPDGDGERERERRYVHRLHAPAHYIRSHSVALPSIRLPCATLHTCLALHCIHTSISFHSISFSSIPFHFIFFHSIPFYLFHFLHLHMQWHIYSHMRRRLLLWAMRCKHKQAGPRSWAELGGACQHGERLSRGRWTSGGFLLGKWMEQPQFNRVFIGFLLGKWMEQPPVDMKIGIELEMKRGRSNQATPFFGGLLKWIKYGKISSIWPGAMVWVWPASTWQAGCGKSWRNRTRSAEILSAESGPNLSQLLAVPPFLSISKGI